MSNQSDPYQAMKSHLELLPLKIFKDILLFMSVLYYWTEHSCNVLVADQEDC